MLFFIFLPSVIYICMSLPAVQKIVEHDNCLHTAGHKNWRRSGRLEPVSQRKKSHFLVEAKSSGNLKGEQRVHGAAQLIGLMMDDTLMTTTCDPALALALFPCVCSGFVQQRQPHTTRAKLQGLFSEQSAVTAQHCSVCMRGFVVPFCLFLDGEKMHISYCIYHIIQRV